ncbi:GNAT family N-acetyltransferase [Pseudomonas savastanoi]|uniref:GNAT family N-acetyltransferase n=1 Tax=Pseudomonas savastanoi TaxID=29438 RepID=UPI000E327CAB|nr:GNAT family N-acetyltransferase [Pseudomonas savastanoi]
MTKKSKGKESPIKIRQVHKDRLAGDMSVRMCLAAFYGIEMSKALGWSVEHRYTQLMQMPMMIQAGHSKMYIASGADGMPMGMIITTKTNKHKIRRLEAIQVFEPYRGRGVARQLLNEARGGVELHSYAIPNAVEWHLKNGFRNLGLKEVEGTFEMFTGNFKPEYGFDFVMPTPNAQDSEAIRHLKQMEQSHLPLM